MKTILSLLLESPQGLFLVLLSLFLFLMYLSITVKTPVITPNLTTTVGRYTYILNPDGHVTLVQRINTAVSLTIDLGKLSERDN